MHRHRRVKKIHPMGPGPVASNGPDRPKGAAVPEGEGPEADEAEGQGEEESEYETDTSEEMVSSEDEREPIVTTREVEIFLGNEEPDER